MGFGDAPRAPAVALATVPRARVPSDPRAILTSIGEVVYDWDIVGDAITWGLNAAEVFGRTDLSALSTGRDLARAVEPESGRTRHETVFVSTQKDLGTGVPFRTRYALRLCDGSLIRVEDTGRWFADGAGRPVLAHGVVRVERDRATSGGSENQGGNVARDRVAFIETLHAEVAAATQGRRPLTLLVLALDELADINDRIGCAAADAVIAEACARIGTVLRRRDGLVRYAGNRFAVALSACPPDQAEVAARRLAEAVEARPIVTATGPVPARLRIGAATLPDHALDAPALLHRAEDALAAARAKGGLRFAAYDPSPSGRAQRRGDEAPGIDVLDALNHRRVLLARQPVLDARSRSVAFAEALVRFRDRAGRLIAAGEVLPGIERSGLVPLIDARMLELAADHLAAHPEERLSINVSPLTLEGPGWLGAFAAHLGARPGIASRLIVEITETAAVRDPEATRIRLDAMKALGVAIAIDDFGAGHTSFKHLRSFPVDLLKIDGAFIQNLTRSEDDRFFVRTLVDLAHHLDILTVAEWVGDEETAALLASWGVDYLQGDHCGAPAVVDGAAAAALALRA